MASAVPKKRVALVLGLSVAAVSTAAVLVRLVPTMHPIGIALWRTAMVAAILAPTLLTKAKRPQGKDLIWTAGAGLCLALHFWAWFASLQHTTVMRSTVLVCLTPVWAGLIEWFRGRDRPSLGFWMGISVALIGVLGMSALHEEGAGSLWGDGLALLGGILAAIYLTIGRVVRQRVDIGPYGAAICGSCALWLLIAALAMGAPIEPPTMAAWGVLLAMALGPQLMGHVGFNFAVRYIPAAVVGAVVLLEPVGATVLATLVLDEWPTLIEILGAVGIVLGVAIATRER